MTKINDYTNKEESTFSTDIHMSLDSTNPLSDEQKDQLHTLASIPDSAVRKEAETDPDCEPLDKPGTVE